VARLVFRVDGSRPTRIEARLLPERPDSLASDNAAWVRLPAARPLAVIVPAHLTAYRQALSALPDVELCQTPASATDVPDDLAITDQPSDSLPRARVCLGVGFVPPDLRGMLRVNQQTVEVVDWERNHALLQHVQFRDVLLLDDPQTAPGITESDLENLGYTVLAHGPHGPLVVEKRTPGSLAFFCLFHPNRSTLPYRVGFPILTMNLVQLATEQAGVGELEADRTGVLGSVTVASAAALCTVTMPDGSRHQVQADAQGRLAGIPAPRAGCYTVSAPGTDTVRLGASLLSAAESGLASVAEIQFSEDLTVRAAARSLPTERPLWASLGLLAFVALLGEWWYYQRRTG